MKCVRYLGLSMLVAMVVLLLTFVLFPMLDSPSMNMSVEGKTKLCVQQIEILLSATNLFETAQEMADNLRYWKDPWGHCYNVIVSDVYADKSFGHVAAGDLIIWSSGPNGINENGGGDDILYSCDPGRQ